MKCFMFLFILPCILAAEIQSNICTDNTQCPQGKYCCVLPNGKSGCCDLEKDLEDKNLVPGVPVSVPANVSMTDPKVMHSPCYGTQCGKICIPDITNGICCTTSDLFATACPQGHKCCGFLTSGWCCPPRSTCASKQNMCRNSAITTSIAMITVLFTAMMGMFSKYFL